MKEKARNWAGWGVFLLALDNTRSNAPFVRVLDVDGRKGLRFSARLSWGVSNAEINENEKCC